MIETKPRTMPPEMRTEQIELSIVMPCLNEARTLGVCIGKAAQALHDEGIAGEIIIADNGSTDGSRELAAECGACVVDAPVRGYGAALARGIASARGRYVVMGDCDDSYDMGNIGPFIRLLREGNDLVMGNRFRGGILEGAMPWSHRYIGNPALTALGRLFFKSGCGDFYCGQRGFRRDVILAMDLQTTGMEYALEMLVKASMKGLRVAEVPVILSPDGRDRRPHLRTWRDGWLSLRMLLIFSPRWLFFYPSIVLMSFGLIVGAFLLAGPREVGGIHLDIHSLVYCASAIIVGFQLFSFSIFAKLLAVVTGLHPKNPRVEALLGGRFVEAGVATGGVLVAVGLAATGLAIGRWAGNHFGDLDPFRMMRIIIPAVLSLTLGLQVIFSSFYLSLLQIQCRRLRAEAQ